MNIYCCGCEEEVDARLTSGKEVYERRGDLAEVPLWICDTCKNYVGCHQKSDTPTNPLGCIPTPQIRAARRELHKVIDPLWRSGKFTRKEVYNKISSKLGKPYHTADLRTPLQCHLAMSIVKRIK